MSREVVFDFAFNARFSAGTRRFTLDIQCRSEAVRLAVIGPSGAGKSLMLQLLAGLQRPQSGHVNIAGRCYGDLSRLFWLPPQQRQVGLVFQDYALFPHLTAAQNIGFGLDTGWQNPKRRRLPEAVSFWLERMQLSEIADHYPHQVSGGQRQRIALARACITRPRWLLLDEPFAALDPDLRSQMRALVGQVQQELAIPMLIISHDMEDTHVLADEVIRMEDGILRHDGA